VAFCHRHLRDAQAPNLFPFWTLDWACPISPPVKFSHSKAWFPSLHISTPPLKTWPSLISESSLPISSRSMSAPLFVAFDMQYRRDHTAPLALATPPIDFHNTKVAPVGPLYLRQQRTVEIIQLVEVDAPPPPRRSPSTFTSSSEPSSSYSSNDSYGSSEFDPEEEEVAATSYCSSDEEEMEERKIAFYDDTFPTRLNRVIAWRDGFAKAMGVSLSNHATSHAPHLLLKRKVEWELDEDAVSLSSKRSRQSAPSEHPPQRQNAWAHRRLSAHSCPACDACFNTRQMLQQHGKESQLNDACRVAVEYGLES